MQTMQDQPTLLDLDSKEILPTWIDPTQPLLVPRNSLHYKAHKLQLLLNRLDKQAQNNAAQFNSKNYTDALDALVAVYDKINSGEVVDNASDDDGSVENDGDAAAAPTLGDGDAASLGAGISADNPFARQGTDPV